MTYNAFTLTEANWRPGMKLEDVLCWVSALFVAAIPVWADNEICLVTAVDGTVENGVGAEAGVVREFAQDLDVPPECQTQAGNTWVLGHELRVTRIEPSSPTVTALVGVRRLGSTKDQEPLHVMIESRLVEVDSSAFPAFGIEWTPFNEPPRAAPALLITPTVAFDGDTSINQFLTVDESAGTPARSCWTHADHGAWEQCTNGNPAIRGVGLAVQAAPYVSHFPSINPTPKILGVLPNGSSTLTIDFSGFGAAGDVIDEVALREKGNQIPFFSSLPDFPMGVPLSANQQALARQSELIVILTPKIIPLSDGVQTPVESQLISADHYVFFNGFESGDGSYWSAVVP